MANAVVMYSGKTVFFYSDDIKTLYGLCASELAVNNNPDWCRLLSDVDTDVLQYNSDIEVITV